MRSQRPVTPLGIIAHNLEQLRERAESLSYVDSWFVETLAETARLAGGLEGYLLDCCSPESATRRDLASDTAQRDWTALHASGATGALLESEMVSGHVEGQLLNMLVRTARATRILEVGLFTGYSALAMAEALPADGHVVACEIDAFAAGIARQWFDRSPHGEKIRIELGPALATLERLRDSGEWFDFVFIDADKARYGAYYDLIIGSDLLAADGLVCVDNTLYQGESYSSESRSASGQAIADFNRTVASDPRVEQVLLPLRDGVTLIRRASR